MTIQAGPTELSSPPLRRSGASCPISPPKWDLLSVCGSCVRNLRGPIRPGQRSELAPLP